MKCNTVLAVKYKPFHKNRTYSFNIEPYCVKLFEKRWYLLGRNVEYDELRIYALDRILFMTVTKSEFKLPKDFNAERYFSTAFGIVILQDSPAERIVVRAYRNQKHYLQSLPLHHSQRCVNETEDYADFELYIAPTYDLIMRLLQCGPMIEVLTPGSLRDAMKDWSHRIHQLYE